MSFVQYNDFSEQRSAADAIATKKVTLLLGMKSHKQILLFISQMATDHFPFTYIFYSFLASDKTLTGLDYDYE